MICKLQLRNFQSHKRSIIELSKGVNVFTGQSDKGKTAIIRAIRFIKDNKPSGDEFRSWWGGNTEVEVTFDEGNIIKRTRTNTENSYTINDETPLKAFGQGVPDEVKKILNLDDVNVQNQMDAPFLLSETSGEVANHFNRIAGISIIDKSISKAKSAIAKTKQSIEHYEEDLTEKQEQFTKYKDLDVYEKEVKTLNDLDGQKRKLDGEIVTLNMWTNRIKKINNQLENINEFLQLEKPVKDLLIQKDKAFHIAMNIARINKLLKSIDTIDKQLTDSDTLLNLEPTIKELLTKQHNKGLVLSRLKALNNLVGKYITLTNKWQENQEKLVGLDNTLTVYWGNTEFCPLCKQEIKHEHIN